MDDIKRQLSDPDQAVRLAALTQLRKQAGFVNRIGSKQAKTNLPNTVRPCIYSAIARAYNTLWV